MFTFLDMLEAHRNGLTEQEYTAVRNQYLSGDEDGAIRALDNIFRKKLREYVKRRGIQK